MKKTASAKGSGRGRGRGKPDSDPDPWTTEVCFCGCTILYPTGFYWSPDAVVTERCQFHDPASTDEDREAWWILKGARQ